MYSAQVKYATQNTQISAKFNIHFDPNGYSLGTTVYM